MRNGQPRIAWTQEEDAFLREHGPRFSRRTISKELNLRFGNNRSHQAVKFRCYALKIRSEAFHRSSGAVARKWTPSEDLVLKQLLGSKSVKEIAAGLGRTPWSVVTRAHKLGLQCRMTHERMSVNEAIRKAGVSRQTFLAAAQRIGVELPFVNRCRREVPEEALEKIREHLESRRRLVRVRVLRTSPVKVERPPRAPRVRKPKPEPEPKIEVEAVQKQPTGEPERQPGPVSESKGSKVGVDMIRKRHVYLKARAYFEKMGEYNATISLVEIMRKAGAIVTIAAGRVVASPDMDVIEEAAVASGYRQKMNKGVAIYCLTKTDSPL